MSEVWSHGLYMVVLISNSISSPTYKNVVTQFLAGNFYCKFGIYNAKSMFCQNIVPLGQLEAEILIDLCYIKRSYSINRFLILSKGRMSLNDQSFVPIRQRYLYESIIQKNTFQSIWHQFSIISSTLKGSFLRFYGSDPGDTTFWNSTNHSKVNIDLDLWKYVFWLSWKVVLFELRHFYM